MLYIQKRVQPIPESILRRSTFHYAVILRAALRVTASTILFRNECSVVARSSPPRARADRRPAQ